MRILIASKRAPGTPGRRDGGVQTWVSTVAAELRRIGHTADMKGAADPLSRQYDLGIFANARHTADMVSACSHSLLVVHGVVSDETPLPHFDHIVYTSEGVRDSWMGAGPIIRQPIDLNFWRPGVRTGKQIVRYAARGGLEWLPALADKMDMSFCHVRNLPADMARAVLQDAAVVLASGRCAVEAMACGVPVVICDERHYQGPLLDTDALGAMTRNYSGRGGIVPTLPDVERAIKMALAGGSMRSHVERHHDVRAVVDQLLEAA